MERLLQNLRERSADLRGDAHQERRSDTVGQQLLLPRARAQARQTASTQTPHPRPRRLPQRSGLGGEPQRPIDRCVFAARSLRRVLRKPLQVERPWMQTFLSVFNFFDTK